MSIWVDIDCTEFERLLLSLESGQAQERSNSVRAEREEPLWDILSYEHSGSLDRAFRRLLGGEPNAQHIYSADFGPSL